MKKLALALCLITQTVCPIQFADQTKKEETEQFSILQSETFVYEILRSLQDYKTIETWEDVKSFVVDLYNHNSMVNQIVDSILDEPELQCLEIVTVEKLLDFLGALDVMQDILSRMVQTTQDLQIEISKLQYEDSFDGWIEIVQDIEQNMNEDGLLVKKTNDFHMKKIQTLLANLKDIQDYWGDKVKEGRAFYF